MNYLNFQKKHTLLAFIIIVFVVSSIAFIQHRQGNTIVGTWVSVNDQNNKWIYTNDRKAKSYYDGELINTYTYRISTSSPQCGEQVQTGPKLEFLELTNVDDGSQKCFYINTLDEENLSLSPFNRSNILLFERQ